MNEIRKKIKESLKQHLENNKINDIKDFNVYKWSSEFCEEEGIDDWSEQFIKAIFEDNQELQETLNNIEDYTNNGNSKPLKITPSGLEIYEIVDSQDVFDDLMERGGTKEMVNMKLSDPSKQEKLNKIAIIDAIKKLYKGKDMAICDRSDLVHIIEAHLDDDGVNNENEIIEHFKNENFKDITWLADGKFKTEKRENLIDDADNDDDGDCGCGGNCGDDCSCKDDEEILYETNTPKNIVIYGGFPGNDSVDITDDESSFLVTINGGKPLEFGSNFKSLYVSCGGGFSVLELKELEECFKNQHYNSVEDYFENKSIDDAILVPNFVGKITLKVCVLDEDDNEKIISASKLKNDDSWIMYDGYYEENDLEYNGVIVDLSEGSNPVELNKETYKVYKRQNKLDSIPETEDNIETTKEEVQENKDSKKFLNFVRKAIVQNLEEEIKWAGGETNYYDSDLAGNFSSLLQEEFPHDIAGLVDLEDMSEDEIKAEYGDDYKDRLIQPGILEDKYDSWDMENCEMTDFTETSIRISAGGDCQHPREIEFGVKNGEWYWKHIGTEFPMDGFKPEGLPFKLAFNVDYDKDKEWTLSDVENLKNKIKAFERQGKMKDLPDTDKVIQTPLDKLANTEDFTADEIKEMEEELSNGLVINGQKATAKIDTNGKKLRLVKINELKDLAQNEIQTKFVMYYFEGENENPEVFEGAMLKSTNIEDDEVMFWLDTKTELPFTIDFNKDYGSGTVHKIEDEGDTFTLYMEETTTLIRVEEKMVECQDLRTDEEFQKFLSKIVVYDQDRCKMNNFDEYSDDDLKYFVERMAEVGYILSRGKYQNTGNERDDYFYTLTNKFLRTKKFGFLGQFWDEDEELEDENIIIENDLEEDSDEANEIDNLFKDISSN